MAFQTKTQQSMKNPFTVQPLPKSFYFPSRKKHVDTKQVIEAPLRGCDPESLEVVAETKASSHEPTAPTTGHEEDDSNSRFDETWPGSGRPSSPSALEETNMTAAADITSSIDENLSVHDAVDRLEFYNRWRSKHVTGDIPEQSTLQKYIDRFRSSEPRSREERMKDVSSKKQDFWWLYPGKDLSMKSVAEFERSKELQEDTKASGNGPTSVKLTKEALLAMDEATLHLQTKADMLLSKSEISMTSSGPIVSTRGLGSACSVSDQSTVVDAPAYRPAFVNIKENRAKDIGRSLRKRQGVETHTGVPGPNSKPKCSDILAQWRFRRKMGETQSAVSNFDKPQTLPLKKNLDSEMDVRLEQFRRHLLSHGLPMNPEDVKYERQRMDLLTGKQDEQQHPSHSSSNVQGQPRDDILERLHSITKNPNFTEPVRFAASADVQSSQAPTNQFDGNVNNSNLSTRTDRDHFVVAGVNPLLNKNNTASSSVGDSEGTSFRVDSFGHQVLCDANSGVFNLRKDDSAGGEKDMPASNSKYSSHSDQKCKATQFSKEARPLRDLSLNHASENKSRSHKNLKKKDKEGVENSSQSRYHEESRPDSRDRDQQAYHQYLEAEKPSSSDVVEGETSVTSARGFSREGGPRNVRQQHHTATGSDASQTAYHRAAYNSTNKHGSATQHPADLREVSKSKRKNPRKRSLKIDQVKSLEDDLSSDSEVTKESKASLDGSVSKITELSQSSPKRPELSPRSEKLSDNPTRDVVCEDFKKTSSSSSKRSSRDQKLPGKKTQESNESRCRNDARRFTDSIETQLNRPGSPVQEKWTTKAVAPVPSPGQPVKKAIGQTVTEHFFDSSAVISSVDSWASMFPQSPAAQRSSLTPPVRTPSPSLPPGDRNRTSHHSASSAETRGATTEMAAPLSASPVVTSDSPAPLQSTPVEKLVSPLTDEESSSDEQFHDDPLLKLLRQQRSEYIAKLELIEQRLQEFCTSDLDS